MREGESLLKNFCLESSILGLKYFYLYPDKISRCFWAISLVSVLSGACLLTWMLYSRFLDMPTRITIENQYEPIQNIAFPAVTLCSPNQITISGMEHFNKTLVDGGGTINLQTTIPQLLGFYELLGEISKKDLESLQNLITLNRYNTLEVMGKIAQSCDEFLKFCSFQSKQFACMDLFSPVLTKHGMCCVFNSVYYFRNKKNDRHADFEPIKTSKTGVHESLTVVADYSPDDAVHGTILNAGSIRIMFTDWTEFPAGDQTTLVYPYTESFHIIHPTYTYCSRDVSVLPSWSRNCYFAHEYSQPHFTEFHNSDCDLLCEVHKLERLCHCTMIYVPKVKSSKACNISNIYCIVEAKMQMGMWYGSEQCQCLRDCVSFQYHVETVLGNLDALPHMINSPYKNISFNETTSIMHFYLPSPVYVTQKQETVMSLISLSSNLGGVFGLCLGCSLISVLEIFFFIYLAIKHKIQKKLLKNSNQINYLH